MAPLVLYALIVGVVLADILVVGVCVLFVRILLRTDYQLTAHQREEMDVFLAMRQSIERGTVALENFVQALKDRLPVLSPAKEEKP